MEYNYGRSFQGLGESPTGHTDIEDDGAGVAHLAVVHFERVLKSVKARMNASGDPEVGLAPHRFRMVSHRDHRLILLWQEVRQSSLAYQAAHNLMLLYASSGNGELVQARSMWLAI